MNILITGGAGYIGSHIVEKLVNKKNIIILDNLKTGYKKLINKKAIFIKGDIKQNLLKYFIFLKFMTCAELGKSDIGRPFVLR